VSELDQSLEFTILALLRARQRGPGGAMSTICPSEAAQAKFPADWPERMEQTRRAARRLVAQELIEITQAGRVVDPSTAKGPIRLRLCPNAPLRRD
jgi:Protein of unknown function (DUF3253)